MSEQIKEQNKNISENREKIFNNNKELNDKISTNNKRIYDKIDSIANMLSEIKTDLRWIKKE